MKKNETVKCVGFCKNSTEREIYSIKYLPQKRNKIYKLSSTVGYLGGGMLSLKEERKQKKNVE